MTGDPRVEARDQAQLPRRVQAHPQRREVIVQAGPDEHEVELRWDDEPEKFQSQGSQTARAKNHWAEALRVLEQGLRRRSEHEHGAGARKTPPGAKNHRFNASAVVFLRLNAPNRRFMYRKSWRERREQKTIAEGRYPVPRGLETHFIPAFHFSWPITLTRIANGEIVIDEVVASSASGHPDPAEAQETESSNPVVP